MFWFWIQSESFRGDFMNYLDRPKENTRADQATGADNRMAGKLAEVSKLAMGYNPKEVPTKHFNFRPMGVPSAQKGPVRQVVEWAINSYADAVKNTLTVLRAELDAHARTWANDNCAEKDRDAVVKEILSDRNAGYNGAIERLASSPCRETISDMLLNGSFEEKRVAISVAAMVVDSDLIDPLRVVINRELVQTAETAILKEAIRCLGNYKRLEDTAKCELIFDRLKWTFEHDDEGVRATALNTLRKVLDSEHMGIAEKGIIEMLGDRDKGVRIKAVVALSVSSSEESIQALETAIGKEKDADVAAAMFLAIESVCARREQGCGDLLGRLNAETSEKKYKTGDVERFKSIRWGALVRENAPESRREQIEIGTEHESRRVNPMEKELMLLQISVFALKPDDLRTGIDVNATTLDAMLRGKAEHAAKR